MCIQRRHLKVLNELINSDVIDPHMTKDLVLIYNTLDKMIRERGINRHFKDEIEAFPYNGEE